MTQKKCIEREALYTIRHQNSRSCFPESIYIFEMRAKLIENRKKKKKKLFESIFVKLFFLSFVHFIFVYVYQFFFFLFIICKHKKNIYLGSYGDLTILFKG